MKNFLANQIVLYSLILLSVAILLTIPDVIFGFLLDTSHTLFDFFLDSMHTLLEGIEYALDYLVESIFHTDLQKTQLIVFYIMLSMGFYVAYVLLKISNRYYRHCKNRLSSLWLQEKTLLSLYWYNLSLISKLKLLAIISCLAYLFFLVSF